MEKGKGNFNNSYINLPTIYYTKQYPVAAPIPKLIIFNESLATSLGVSQQLEGFAGNEIPKEAEPLAQAYAGHQFGYFTMLGDGRAALGPMLREYIISKAMYALGIPTTRSLAVVTTGEIVKHDKNLPGAVLTRVASSHIRVGTFEYASGRIILKV